MTSPESGAVHPAGPDAVGAIVAADADRTAALVLLPAVDVSGGQAVRLVQGAAGTETDYGDPLDAALAWQRAGAPWIHLVDLDAAFGRGSNAPLLAGLIGKLAAAARPPGAAGPAGAAVELSGGIRDDASLAAALATGCQRVVIGTAALEHPDWVRDVIARHGERIAVGLDVGDADTDTFLTRSGAASLACSSRSPTPTRDSRRRSWRSRGDRELRSQVIDLL